LISFQDPGLADPIARTLVATKYVIPTQLQVKPIPAAKTP